MTAETKRALLIGGSTHERAGIKADVDLMQRVLCESYGFRPKTGITRCVGQTSREVILGALETFAATVRDEDAAVVYYTGHGGVARFDDPIGGESQPLREWRYLVPEVGYEFHAASKGRFGGVLDVEIGHILGELSERCPNLTVIFECCFAGGMLAIPPKQRSKDRGHVHTFSVPEQLRGEQVWSKRSADVLLPLESTWRAPIVVAAVREGAKSNELNEGAHNGAFTWALCEVLTETASMDIAWETLMHMVSAKLNEKLGERGLGQSPILIGPRGRQVFGTTTHDLSCQYNAMVGPEGQVRLLAGSLHALRDGDRVDLLDPGSCSILTRGQLADTGAVRASLELNTPIDRPPWTPLTAMLSARERPTPVNIVGDSPLLTELRAALRDSVWVYEADDVEVDESECLELRVVGDQLWLSGTGIHRDPEFEEGGERLSKQAAYIIAELAAIAQARGFEQACADLSAPPKDMEFWLRAKDVDTDESRILTSDDDLIDIERDRVDVGMRFCRDYVGARHMVSLVNLGLDGLAYLKRSDSGTGFDLVPEAPGESQGIERYIALHWPPGVPRETMTEKFYFIVTTAPAYLDSVCYTAVDLDSEGGRGLDEATQANLKASALDRRLGDVKAWKVVMSVRVRPGPQF